MTDWNILYSYRGSNRDVTGYWRNIVGSPVLSAVKVPPGAAGFASPMAGVFRFTFETMCSVSCSLVSKEDTDNPLIFSGTRTVTADGATGNLNVLAGWSIVFARDVQAGDVFEVGVGCYFDSTLALWQRVLSFGPRIAGYISGERDLTIQNDYGSTLTDCILVATNATRVENDQAGDRPFYCFCQTGIRNPEADDDLNGTAVTFDNYVAGSPATVDILVDGDPIDVYDVTNGEMIPGGEGLSCDGTTVYRFGDGSKYQSVTFILSENLAETDTATIYVSDGGDSVWIAQSGGSLISGTCGLILTEPGQCLGTVADQGEVDVSIRLDPGADAVDLNARSFSLRVIGMDGTTEVSVEFQGSFYLTDGGAPLNFRINVMSEKYENPDEVGGDGYYENYADYLAANGITFPNA